MESNVKEYIVRNALAYAYDALRSKERLIGESTVSYYEEYFQQLLEKLGPPGKKWEMNVNNSEVESFYLGRVSLGEFRLHTKNRVFAKVPGWDFAPFASLIWSECCSVPDKALLCTKLDSGIGRQIWEIFLGLDVDSHGKIHVDDLSDLIQRVLRENGHMELEQNIKEWFCDEILVDFWSFFAAIVENYSGLLKPNIIRALHELLSSEILLSGKLTKKGHKIHSWRERWFVLQTTQLSYYETQETMVLKGTISIGAGTQVDFLPDTKSHQRRFRILDSQTQVPYEICTPDVTSLQQWNNGIQVAVAMNKVSGTNFLHRLTLAQKQVFPGNTVFSISAVSPSGRITPPPKSHQSLPPSQSVPLTKNVPPQPTTQSTKNKLVSELQHQSSFPTSRGNQDEIFDDPPPVPQQILDAPPVVPRQKPRGAEAVDISERKARRRHSSINYSVEFEKEQEKEREKLDHVTVGGAMYAVVSKPVKKNGRHNAPERTASEKEVRRILPKTPSPSSQRRGYIQLEFQNGTSNIRSQQTPSVPAPMKRGITPTKFNYSKVVFDKETQKRKESEFENDDNNSTAKKKNKPLPPPPPGTSSKVKTSSSDSNMLAPQPVPRKKPQSLTDLRQQQQQQQTNGQQKGLEYAAIGFSPPSSTTENGTAAIPSGATNGRKAPPKLPPKQDSIDIPSGRANGRKEPPKLPPKQDSIDTPSVGANGRKEPPKLPPKQDSIVSPSEQNKPRPKPVPKPRLVSPSSEAPPPIPMRRSPIPPT